MWTRFCKSRYDEGWLITPEFGTLRVMAVVQLKTGNLAMRGITGDDKCPICKRAVESTLNTLWDCKKIDYASLEWRPKRVMFRCNYASFLDLINYLAELGKSLAVKEKSPLIACGGERICHWRPPEPGVFEINCDASPDARRKRNGIGIVIRDASSLVMTSCCQVIKAAYDTTTSNTMAIYRSNVFSREYELTHCIIDSDVGTVVKRILNGSHFDYRCGIFLANISRTLAGLECLSIKVVTIIANRVAVGLAKRLCLWGRILCGWKIFRRI
ncbi:hypothetical protein Dsin_014109 [Dipteronia sinensis]|uniref:RNase H type-1 domain-containing protein n=1 Tax=Dipteronia sinensis TaxID=43782 RepID=A0AAE0AMG1_9ROSI|nr:hypothetical protein Dsin_014109 [Dipteronia sinensis]